MQKDKKNQTIPILYCHFGENWIRGSERVLIDLIKGLDQQLYRPIVWTNVVPMVNWANKAGIESVFDSFSVYFDYYPDKFKIYKYIKSVLKSIKIINQYQIKIIHANGAAPCQWLAVASLLTGVPILAHLHSIYPLKTRIVCLLHLVDKLVGVSSATLVGLRRDGVNDGTIALVPNGVDDSRFLHSVVRREKIKNKIDRSSIILGGVGSLIYRKGWDVALKALAKCETNVYLVIVGSGEDKKCLEDHVEQLRIRHRVEFHDQCDNPSYLYNLADIILVPSRVEAFGLVAVEAALFAKPVIASDVGGITDFITNNITGILVPSEDHVAFARAIDSLASDLDSRVKIGLSAQRLANSRFLMNNMVEEFSLIYNKMDQKRANVFGKLFQFTAIEAKIFIVLIIKKFRR